MRLELTITGQDGEHDVAVYAPAHATVGQLLAGLGATRGLWAGERSLPAHTRLDSGELRSGDRVSVCGPAAEQDTPALLGLHQVAGPGAGRSIALSRDTTLVLGRAPGCDVVLDDQDASRRHALIKVHAATATVRDLDSTNGTTVDQQTVGRNAVPLPPGAYLRVGCCAFTVGPAFEAPAVVRLDALSGARHIQRPPPAHRAPPSVEIAFPTAPRASRPHSVQWIAALVPAMVGVAIAWVTGSPQFLLFMLLSPVMMLSSSLGDRVHWRRSRRRAAASYHVEVAAAQLAMDEALRSEAMARRNAFADPVTVLRTAELPGRRLWERRRTDPDLLRLRVGTADLPSLTMRRDGSVTCPAGTLSAVPFDVDLRAGALGVAGPRDVTTGLMRWLIGQLATAHAPGDVELALFLTTTRATSWRWARWLPHLDGRVAVTDGERADLVAWLGTEIDRRRAASRPNSTWRGAWLIVVLDSVADRALDPTFAAMLSGANDIGVTAMFVADDRRELPGACESQLIVGGAVGNRAWVASSSVLDKQVVVPDLVSQSWAERVARGLAPFVAGESSGGVGEPAEATLARTLALDLDDLTADLRRRWSHDDGGARVTLGHTAEGPLSVDLDAEGPHLLVAGTTGSGKSELLQTLVASLASAHSPEHLSVLMIDYKGGAAFAECADLPHCAGLVTDLDAYLTARALQSLTGELRRREQLFAAADATDLASYRSSAPRIPVPRLVIVVDEFAALVDELPDFVRGLVSIAQRGRSLGVHLVLATQRPSTVVSAEIRANTSLRIALRVTDAADSIDVIGDAGAALIDPRTPGRAYLRSGSGLTSFHTAWSGARSGSDTGMRLEPLDPWRRHCPASADAGDAADVEVPTDLARLVRAAREGAGNHRTHAPWLPALPAAIPRSDLGHASSAALVRFGLRDEPHAQRQSPVELDLDDGTSLLVAGAARSGRTQTLATLAVAAASQLEISDLHIHVVDPVGDLTGQLRGLPHLASVLGPHDSDLVPRLLRRLGASAAAQPERARTLLLIDGWPSVLADLADVDALDCADLLATALRLGSSSRLTTALTGDRTSLAPRFAGQFAQRLLLRLDDRADYAMCGVPLKQIPEALPAGRAMCANDGAIVQLAHCGRAPGADGVHTETSIICAGSGARAQDDRSAVCVRALPASVGLRELARVPGRLTLGVGGDAAEALTVELPKLGTHLLVAGPPRSGRSTLLLSLLIQAVASGTPVVVAAAARSPLAAEARAHAVPVIGPDDRSLPERPDDSGLLLVDDCEAFVDSPAGDDVLGWLRSDAPISTVVAGRSDDLAGAYRGIGAYVRRGRCGVLLRPGPMDGELLGIRLPRRAAAGPPGRGIIVGEPRWGPPFDEAEPVPIQIATA